METPRCQRSNRNAGEQTPLVGEWRLEVEESEFENIRPQGHFRFRSLLFNYRQTVSTVAWQVVAGIDFWGLG